MAANAQKTNMVNKAVLKLGGATSIATTLVDTIDDSVFANPSTATDETTRLACFAYPGVLKKALRDIEPKFARRYADLGGEVKITQDGASGTPFEQADWELMFELPSDYLALIAQIDETSKTTKYEATEITVHSWAHVVKGSDGQAYYCDTAHTSVDDSADGQPPDDDGDANWTLFSTDDDDGADHEFGRAYQSAQTGKLLLCNDYSNEDGDSAYIEYIAYVTAGVGDMPQYYDEDFIEAFTTLLASEMAPYTVEKGVRTALRLEYERLAKLQAQAAQSEPDYQEEPTTWLDARTA